ncbi:UDP-glycosyltransferase 74F2 [Camellia lanceoleosa]|uniref:UDP-glycosyltransferase 74F2 n=1 Tax=Camellia lanceoleosa TaxID=1840588 RepID=A0ACC0HTV0_9ERIC|nr:UDP-glycosyltransferase 74F2 [Camellia lanceoleosa]
MGKPKRAQKPHCLVLPHPIQGHINPMLQFSKRLEHKGVKVTLAITQFIFNETMTGTSSSSISVETISDGYDEGGPEAASGGFEEYLLRFQEVGSKTLAGLVVKFGNMGCPVDCIVYDAFLPWGLDVAREFGLVGAVFFTQSCAVDNIYYHVYNGHLKLPLTETTNIMVPGLPPLEISDMPSFVSVPQVYPPLLKLVVNQFANVGESDWVLCNTFHKLEEELVDWMAKIWPLRTIGPTIPSMYLDKRLQDDKEYGFSIFKPKTDACMKWLDQRSNGSVVYVSFGSLAQLGVDQMEEIAWGLKNSNYYFLWVVRATEQPKLPKVFMAETVKNGLVVSWCPQLDVLAHRAIGCFVTHSGWNSTLEALSLGVPMVAMPQWTDQTTNAKYVMDVWGMGVRAQCDERGMVRREEVEGCIREVMEGERGKEIRRNAMKWGELAIEAVDEGGSSDKNIDEFVAKLVKS